MCGRYALYAPASVIAEVFGLDGLPELQPRYNAAPTDTLPVVLHEDGPVASLMRWGLVPSSSKTGPKGKPLINVTSEAVATRFARALAGRRVLVPMDGFYEWTADKSPFLFRRPDRALLAAAGIWATWTPPDGGPPLRSFAILTTRPTPAVASLHDRMPVLLPAEGRRAWLDPDSDPAALARWFEPDRSDPIERVPVSRRVNSVRNDDPGVLEASD